MGKMSYLLVLAGAGIGAFVPVVVVVVVGGFSLQPVSSAPANTLNRTIRMYILFIVRLTLTTSVRKTSVNFQIVSGARASSRIVAADVQSAHSFWRDPNQRRLHVGGYDSAVS
jgi:hypothetical protein